MPDVLAPVPDVKDQWLTEIKVENSAKLKRYQAIAQQVNRLANRIDALNERNRIWSWARLITFLAGAALVLVALFGVGQLFFWISLGLVVLVFSLVVATHRRFEHSLSRHQRWHQIKKEQLARMRLDWDGLPPPRVRPNFDHPYEGDLDLVGDRSLACLIDLSLTESGGQRLRAWLADPTPALHEIERRQRLVGELLPKHLLRMQLLGNAQALAEDEEGNARAGWDATELEEWLNNLATVAGWRLWLLLGWLLAGINILLLLFDQLFGGPALWPYSWIIYGLFLFAISTFSTAGSDRRDVFDDAIRLRKPFEQLVTLFSRLETYSYRDVPEFKKLCTPFLDLGHQPSRYLKRLVRIINATGMRGNPLIWLVLNLLAPWDIHFAYELDRCKEDLNRLLPIWLDAWAEIEVLNSLANLGYLNPQYQFPTLIEPNGDTHRRSINGTGRAAESPKSEPLLAATELGHPLLPDLVDPTDMATTNATGDGIIKMASKVSNDFVLSQIGEVRLITGSNMAGKSTFLRTVGVNMALAYAGAPVDASALTLQRMRLFTSIKVTDSVTDGISYFYAEVKRLRSLLDALEESEELPVFFFIDEIYRGTNNRERLVGSRAYITALAGMNGVGMISTHDLDLVTLADGVAQIKNYHFRDEVRNGRMYFDYTLRPGPCPTTNALKIMAMEGLPAGEEN